MTVSQKLKYSKVCGLGLRGQTDSYLLLRSAGRCSTVAKKSTYWDIIQTQPSSHFSVSDELRLACASEPSRDLVKTALPPSIPNSSGLG